jgi:hypothetical protein
MRTHQQGMLPRVAVAKALSEMRRATELVQLGALAVVYLVVYAFDFAALYDVTNTVGPAVLMSILFWSCYRMVRQSPIVVWAPLFWFRLACAVYFGFGALVPHLAGEETRQQIFDYYRFDDAENLKVNLVHSVGIFACLLFSYCFLSPALTRNAAHSGTSRKSPRTKTVAIGFLLGGGTLRYLFTMPYMFGLTETVLPGAVVALAAMYYVGIYLLIVHGITRSRRALSLSWVLIGIEIFVSVASFAKTELLLILIFSFLGFISLEASRRRIAVGALCVVGAYFAFQPLVMHGRDELVLRYGQIRGAGLAERWDIVEGYLEGRSAPQTGGSQGLLRLSYVNAAAFVMSSYDAGVPGNTLDNALAVFIPRVLWPDKPIITRLGEDLYYLMQARDGSSMGVGHFAEAYWNFGWRGILPFMLVIALILSIFTRVSMAIMANGDWLYLPVVFLGVNAGLRVDGHFVPDLLGGCWIALCVGAGIKAVGFALDTRHRPQTAFSRRRVAR